MRIAVNAGSFEDDDINSVDRHLLHFAALHSDFTFFFFFDQPLPDNSVLPENVIPVVIKQKMFSTLHLWIRYNLKIPIALRKYKADFFVSEKTISLKTKIPQILISPDLRYIFQPLVFERRDRFYKKNMVRFLDKAREIIVNSCSSKKEIIEQLKISEEKIKVVYPEISDVFKKIDSNEKELIKEKYADGNEYFIYKGIISPQQNLLNLLKAFSYFKKRQKSKMQLLVVGNRGTNYGELMESLRLFRFKKEVKILENIPMEETGRILASAYAVINIPVYQNSPSSVLEAMKSGVPVLASSLEIFKEFCGEAALYAEPEQFKDIAEKMMQLFRDERMRKQMIEKADICIEDFQNKKGTTFLSAITEFLNKI